MFWIAGYHMHVSTSSHHPEVAHLELSRSLWRAGAQSRTATLLSTTCPRTLWRGNALERAHEQLRLAYEAIDAALREELEPTRTGPEERAVGWTQPTLY